MAERVEFELRLVDGITPKLKAIKTQGINTFDTLIKKSKDFNKSLKNTGTRFDTASRQSNNFMRSLKGIASVYAALRISKMFLQEQIRIDNATLSFETFYRSAETADKVMTRLMRFANVTPFDDRQVISAGRALAAFGIEAKQLEPTMKMLGDISAATGKDLVELTNIYGKTKQLGRVYNYQINQLARSGIPIITELAKVFGTTEMNIRNMSKEGKISFADMQTAFINLTKQGGMFHNLMAKQAKTLGGRISTLWGKFQLFGAKFSQQVMDPILRPFIEWGIVAMELKVQIVDTFRNVLNALKPIKDAFTAAFSGLIEGEGAVMSFSNFLKYELAPVIYVIANGIAFLIRTVGIIISILKPFRWVIVGVIAALKIYKWAVAIATAAQWAWNAAMTANPVGLIIVAIAALVAGIVYLWNNVEGFRNFWVTAWKSMTDIIKFAGVFLKQSFILWKAIYFDPLINIIKFVGRIAHDVITGDFLDIGDAWKEYKQGWIDSANTAIESAKKVKGAYDVMSNAVKANYTNVAANSDKYKINLGKLTGFKQTDAPKPGKRYEGYSDKNVKLIELSGAEGDAGGTGVKGSGLKGASKVSGSIAKPSIINIDFHPVLEIEIVSNELPEATEEIQKEFEKMIVDVANISGRVYQ